MGVCAAELLFSRIKEPTLNYRKCIPKQHSYLENQQITNEIKKERFFMGNLFEYNSPFQKHSQTSATVLI